MKIKEEMVKAIYYTVAGHGTTLKNQVKLIPIKELRDCLLIDSEVPTTLEQDEAAAKLTKKVLIDIDAPYEVIFDRDKARIVLVPNDVTAVATVEDGYARVTDINTDWAANPYRPTDFEAKAEQDLRAMFLRELEWAKENEHRQFSITLFTVRETARPFLNTLDSEEFTADDKMDLVLGLLLDNEDVLEGWEYQVRQSDILFTGRDSAPVYLDKVEH